jgi:hypothetical protein
MLSEKLCRLCYIADQAKDKPSIPEPEKLWENRINDFPSGKEFWDRNEIRWCPCMVVSLSKFTKHHAIPKDCVYYLEQVLESENQLF